MPELIEQDKNIISLLGLESLPEEKRLDIVKRATALVEKRMLVRLMEALPADQVEKANALTEKPDELSAFLFSFVENPQELIAQEVEAVRNQMMLDAAEAEVALEE